MIAGGLEEIRFRPLPSFPLALRARMVEDLRNSHGVVVKTESVGPTESPTFRVGPLRGSFFPGAQFQDLRDLERFCNPNPVRFQ